MYRWMDCFFSSSDPHHGRCCVSVQKRIFDTNKVQATVVVRALLKHKRGCHRIHAVHIFTCFCSSGV